MTKMAAEYMTHSGDDALVANAARVSFAKETMLVGINNSVASFPRITEGNRRKVDEFRRYAETMLEKGESEALSYPDHRLINFLAEEYHLLPFRHPHITLRCKVPMFVARQMGKHQVGMTWSEESRRYIDSDPEFWWPEKWRKRAADKKQGSSDEVVDVYREKRASLPDDPLAVQAVMMSDYQKLKEAGTMEQYKYLLSIGIAPEQARMILPQNMMVNWVWTGSLLSWFHLYDQRTGHGAQAEAAEFAELIKKQIAPLYPAAWAALEKNCRNFKIEEV